MIEYVHVSRLMCILICIFTMIDRYVIHLWDMNTPTVWENRSMYIYYTELGFELAVLSVDFGHHLHMLVCISKTVVCIYHLISSYITPILIG